MVALLEVVAFAPEERTFVTIDCAVLVGPRDEARETDRPAVVVVVVITVLVRVANVLPLSPLDARVLARYSGVCKNRLPTASGLLRVLGGCQNVAIGIARWSTLVA